VLAGAHCSGGVRRALDRAAEIGADAVQLFTQSPRTWRVPEPDPEAYERFRQRREELGVGAVLCHAIYLVNLAAPNDDVYEKSLAAMRGTMEVACAIDAEAVVFHVGSHLGSGFDVGLERALPAMRQLLELCSERTWLLMENSAGAGGTIGRSVDELVTLWERLDRHPRLGVCLDSCHLYVSGYDVTDSGAVDRLVDDLDTRMGLDRLRALHVNDSKAPLGSNRDRHENVLDGLIGESLGAFLAHSAFRGLPAVLEVPGQDGHGPDADELRKLRELNTRWESAAGRTGGARPRRGSARGPRRKAAARRPRRR
jgi:deoxyribonuclease IV